MPERRAPSTAGSDDSGAAAVRPEEQRHRWRRNPALSPQVKLAPHYISTGGDMPGARVPSTALSDDGGAPDGKSKEHRHTRWQNPPSSPPVNLRPQITSMGGARTAPRGSPPGQSPGRAGGLKRGQAGRRGATRLAVAMGVEFKTTSADLHEGVGRLRDFGGGAEPGQARRRRCGARLSPRGPARRKAQMSPGRSCLG